jgi:hypothetical protein
VIFRRITLALAAAAALAASAAVFVVALAFALYALVIPYVGPAGAAAVVAGSTGLLIALGALAMTMGGRPKRKAPPSTAEGIFERGLEFVRENPALAITAAIGAGFMAIRNPQYLGNALRAFVEGSNPSRR